MLLTQRGWFLKIIFNQGNFRHGCTILPPTFTLVYAKLILVILLLLIVTDRMFGLDELFGQTSTVQFGPNDRTFFLKSFSIKGTFAMVAPLCHLHLFLVYAKPILVILLLLNSNRSNVWFGRTVRPNFYCSIRPK